jgi:serine phosphatase RsbU (regulator of sigma subunit)
MMVEMDGRWRQTLALLVPGILAFLVAGLSVVDMFLPKPYDGVVLESDRPGTRRVRAVVPGSGAAQAGVHAGDLIVGIDRTVLEATTHAQEILNRHSIGDVVPYLIRSGGLSGPVGHMVEVDVELGRRQIGDTSYLYAAVLGFVFFGVGLFVLVQQPRMPASRVFFTMCALFMLFLVCRLRPASYSWVDSFVLTTGTMALLLLPAAFLHFFLIFPRKIWEWRSDPIADAVAWLAERNRQLVPIYLVPPAVYVATVAWGRWRGVELDLISGAPAANWWIMVGSMVLGLGALGMSARHLPDQRQRRGAGIVFLGTLFGVVPFVVLAVLFPSFLHTERFMIFGVIPLILVPLTFAYAIIRFGLMDIRVILRKSLLYTMTTALVTAAYALGIASFNRFFRDTAIADSPFFPVIFALAIVLLFEPLRHRLQGPVDRFFFAERHRLQRAMVEMGRAMTDQSELGPVVHGLVDRLPGLLRLHFAALYLWRGDRLVRVAGPESLPESVVPNDLVHRHLKRAGLLARLDDLAPLRLLSQEVDDLGRTFAEAGVEVLGLLATSRRTVGVILLSGTSSQTALEREEMDLLRSLLQQASLVLETSLLLDERAAQAELERELTIAASIQSRLLPRRLATVGGWERAAVCLPAQEVGGDFYTELPCHNRGGVALAYGDVSGKSISGALVMMAAHEILNSLALAHPEPEELLRLANERLYSLRDRERGAEGGRFVALGYLGFADGDGRLRYALAGQPPPMVVRASGEVFELPMPEHRLPLGAMHAGGHKLCEVSLDPGDLVVGYSDGVAEAQNKDGEFFGEERLVDVLSGCADLHPDQAVHAVIERVRQFTGDAPAYDDVTLVAARFVG